MGTSLVAIATVFFVLVAILVIKKFLLKERRIHNLNDKFVFITGCDSGFGKQTALLLDALGFQVFAACLTYQGERHLQTLCSYRVKTLCLDVTKHESIQKAYCEILEALPSHSGRPGVCATSKLV